MMTAVRKEVEDHLRTRHRLLLYLSQASLPPCGPSSVPSSPRSSQRDGPTRLTRQLLPMCPTSQIPLFLLPASTTLQRYHDFHLHPYCPKYPFHPKTIFLKPPQIPDRPVQPQPVGYKSTCCQQTDRYLKQAHLKFKSRYNVSSAGGYETK